MLFERPLEKGILLRRYKRFLADIELHDGDVITVHCPNTGSMKNCLAPGTPAWFSFSTNPKRKYPYTWEIATTPAGHLAGINTARANALVREALEQGLVPGLEEFGSIRAEVAFGEEGSRVDFLVESDAGPCYIEVKSVTLCEERGCGYFPDSVSARGSKHLRELGALAQAGIQAMLVFCVQHTGIESVAPALHIDPTYGAEFDRALAAGVKVCALAAKITDKEITLDRRVPVITG